MFQPIDSHRRSSNHKPAILASDLCGCFHCLGTFAPAEIRHWGHAGPRHPDGVNAVCPRSGIDSVISREVRDGDFAELLRRMQLWWFGPGLGFWSRLSDAQGSARDLPRLLSEAAEDHGRVSDPSSVWHRLFARLCQGDVAHSASRPAIPYLVDIALERRGRETMMSPLAIAACIQSKVGTHDDDCDVPVRLAGAYRLALALGVSLAAEAVACAWAEPHAVLLLQVGDLLGGRAGPVGRDWLFPASL